MRVQKILILLVICSGLALTSAAQKKPLQPPTAQQQNRQMPEINRPNPAQNEAVVRQVFDDLFTRGRYDLVEKIYAQECIVHQSNRNYRLQESVAEGKGWRSAAPDLEMVSEKMSSQGDIVTVNWTARGTHTGRGNGLIKPTGKHILIHGNSRFRVVNGRIVEVWNNFERNEIFRQLGVPTPVAFLYDETEGIRLAVSRAVSDLFER